MDHKIITAHQALTRHPLYSRLTSLDHLRIFMKHHAFAVWDFMSLLKGLQRHITCVELPWVESKYDPELVRLINEIVLGEESDIDPEGKATSHFALYLKAMDEVGADTTPIKNYIQEQDSSLLPKPISDMVHYHLDLAKNGLVHEIAASFFYGREKLIPDMFTAMVDILEQEQLNCPTLIYYFKRHIELDGEEHGPKAMKCLNGLIDTEHKKEQVIQTALDSLNYRESLWSFIESELN